MGVQEFADAAKGLLLQTAEDANARLRAGDIAGAKKITTAGQRELRNLKRQATDEQRVLRQQFQQSRIDINKSGQAIGMFAGSKARGAMARGRAYEKRRLAQQQQDALVPYDNLKAALDKSIADLDRDKFRIDAAVREAEDQADAAPEDIATSSEVAAIDSQPAPPPPPAAATPPTLPPHWAPDPSGRHELRFWDGSRWTGHVSDGGQQSEDPLPG